ncbi:MAG: hypothetical protein L6R39_006915 [Caloplaca ligustica]|nr:MAG: hypothetical protein L6R39_006915 [Caloplaca ligustica]
MGDFIKGLFGGSKPAPSPASHDDDDFEDFASVPSPTPIYSSQSSSSAPTAATFPDHETAPTPLPYTKWYRVWERASPSDFKVEAFIIPFIIVLAALHIWGRRKNRRKANVWAVTHIPVLEKEFASVGFGKTAKERLGRTSTSEEVPGAGDREFSAEGLLKEKTAQEYTTYATGRANVAHADVRIRLFKRYNPLTLALESAASFLFESVRAPKESMEITLETFDGKEKDLVPVKSKAELDAKESRFKGLQNSSYDACVWAVVHKEQMKGLRDERYDVSLTSTKDHKMLPVWASVMSESAEVTEALLTKELVECIEKAGEDAFEYLIVTDQPIDKPLK